MLQRGMWQFDPTDTTYTPSVVQLDNGNQYNLSHLQKMISDKNDLMKGRKAAMEYKVTAEPKE